MAGAGRKESFEVLVDQARRVGGGHPRVAREAGENGGVPGDGVAGQRQSPAARPSGDLGMRGVRVEEKGIATLVSTAMTVTCDPRR